MCCKIAGTAVRRGKRCAEPVKPRLQRRQAAGGEIREERAATAHYRRQIRTRRPYVTMGVMAAGDPYTTIIEPTFEARFLLNPHTDTMETVAHVDVFVDLPDGTTWALTIFTVDEVAGLLARWKDTGEAANGSYFWVVDQLIVPEPGVAAMTAAIRELVRTGEITSVGIPCDDPRLRRLGPRR
jgi:hypothetical protein